MLIISSGIVGVSLPCSLLLSSCSLDSCSFRFGSLSRLPYHHEFSSRGASPAEFSSVVALERIKHCFVGISASERRRSDANSSFSVLPSNMVPGSEGRFSCQKRHPPLANDPCNCCCIHRQRHPDNSCGLLHAIFDYRHLYQLTWRRPSQHARN